MSKSSLYRPFIALIILIIIISRITILNVKAQPRTITVPDNYPTIQKAIDAAKEGDTVFIKNGVYIENPIINKTINLKGENRDTTIIDVTAGIKIRKDKVTITGFIIYDGYDGISLAANNCTISNNKIKETTHGIVVFGSNHHITGNIFESIGLSSAIQLNYANNNIIKNNYIESCVEGIQIWQNSNNNTITENTIKNCRETAIGFQYSNNNKLTGNSITDSGLGTSIYASNNNIISNNNYVNNTVQFSANEWYYLTWGGSRSVNIISENYWSDYNGTDSNGDSIGDVPYAIDENNMDNYPLMKSVVIPSFPESTPTPVLTPTPSPEPTIPTSPSFPTNYTGVRLSDTEVIIGASIIVAIVIVGLGLLLYLIKRK